MKIGDDGPSWEREPNTLAAFQPVSRREAAIYDPTMTMVHAESEAAGDGGINVLHYLHVLLKWKWVVIGAVALAVTAGIVATLLTTRMYKASSTIQIDREAIKVLNTGDVQRPETGGDEFFQTQFGLLKSRLLAQFVVDTYHLENRKDFLDQGVRRSLLKKTQARPSEGDRSSRVNTAVAMVQYGLQVEPLRPSRLVKLTYTSPNPAVAADIANKIAEGYMNLNLKRRVDTNENARKWLQGQTEEVRRRLEKSEQDLVAYANSKQILEIGGTGGGSKEGAAASAGATSLVAADLSALNSAYTQAVNERIVAQQRYEQAKSNPALASGEALQSTTVQSLRQARSEAATEYQQNLGKWKPEYPEMTRLKARIDELDRMIQAERDTMQGAALGTLQSRYEVALRNEQQLAAKVAQQKGLFMETQRREVGYNTLKRDVETNRAQYADLLERSKSVSVAGSIDANNVSLVDSALTPGAPYKPRPLINLIMSLAVGLLVGGLLALGLEQLDDSIKTPEDVDAKLGVPLLGAIPVLSKGLSPTDALSDPRSAVSEAYYSVRTALQFSTSEGVPANLLVTSARPSEGKSTTAMALAQNFARLGLRTLLIDSDLRNPSLHKVLGRHNAAGLSNLLTGSATLAELLQPTEDANLFFLACGPLPPNPAELLAGQRVRHVLQEVTADFEQVIIDGPPVMGLADAPLLASVTAGTILVIAAGSTRRGLARAALKRLHLSHAKLLGAVLTKFNVHKASYGYGYGYGYGASYAYAYDYGARPDAKQIESSEGGWFNKKRARGG